MSEKTKKPARKKTVSGKKKVEAKPEAPLKEEAPKSAVKKPKKEKEPREPRYYGTGRRKEATAKVWLASGSGKLSVNGRDGSDYFCRRKLLESKIKKPFEVTGNQNNFDAAVEAFGGGIPAQADAVAMGIARALLQVNPELRVKLKRVGLLRRDPRMKERKKYGLKRARRAFQYTKR